MRQNNRIAYFFLKFLEIFNFLWRKRTFPPPSKKPPNLKKSQNLSNKISIYPIKSQNLPPKISISQQKSNLSNLFSSITTSYSCTVPFSLTVFPSKISTSKIQKLSKNIKKLSNSDNKNVTILPQFWGFSPSSTQRQPFLATFLGF